MAIERNDQPKSGHEDYWRWDDRSTRTAINLEAELYRRIEQEQQQIKKLLFVMS